VKTAGATSNWQVTFVDANVAPVSQKVRHPCTAPNRMKRCSRLQIGRRRLWSMSSRDPELIVETEKLQVIDFARIIRVGAHI
jgi:hypothetical protein